MTANTVRDDLLLVSQPQPLGVFPFPAGLLLLPNGDDEVTAVREGLVAGRLPSAWPAALHGHEAAYAGDLDRASLAFADGADVVSRWNAWVLDPDAVDATTLRADLGADLAPLLDVVAFSTGETHHAPEVPVQGPGTVRALCLAARSTEALSDRRLADAVADLLEAADVARGDSPALAALYEANAGTLLWEHGGDRDEARTHLTAAAAVLAETDLTSNRAEVHHQLGALAHEVAAASGAPLREAMHHYYTVTQLVTAESDPHLWASTQLNLATAYLSAPMTEATNQLRQGIATQALRACLGIFTKETHPAQWATATLNLANALVYTPSTHQGDNLVEAVELYEEVLNARPRDVDPVGRARVLTNQGNVLAHLGVFDQAKSKLVEARFLFEEHLDHDSAMMVRSVLDEIARANAGVVDTDDEERQMAQMARMPHGSTPTGLEGVTVAPKPKVTILQGGQP